jgi:hypothetical protein
VARKPGGVVVDPPDEFDETYDHPGLNAWRKSGDYAVLSDPSFAEWEWTVYRLHTPDEVTRLRPSTPRLWVTKVSGPLDIHQIQTNYGGGTFEFWGKFETELRTRIKVDLAGPRKDFNATAIAAVAPAAAPAADPTLMRILENQQRTLDRLENASRSATAAQSLTIKDVFDIAEKMQARQPAPAQPGPGPVAELVSAFREGLSLRDEISGGPERSTTEVILEKVMPLVERVAMAVVSQPQRRIIVPPVSGSTATVVEPVPMPPAEPVTTEEPVVENDYRMASAVEVVANAITNRDDPVDTADVVSRILQAGEIFVLTKLPDDQVIATLRARASGRFPVLDHPEAATYLAAVLAELRNPSQE